MTALSVTIGSTTEQDRATAVITMAFSGDPIVRWVFPQAHQYLTYWPRFVSGFGGRAFENSTAHHADSFCGVALWLPPGVGPDEEAMGGVLEEGIPASRQGEIFALVEKMGPFHPGEPHWYLPLMGVDPRKQGQGYGSALMQYALKTCDQQGVQAYLEATSPGNKRLYERHGFEETGVIQVGSSPPMWPMVRKPQRT
jgi:GNAT superfamily N-acetyltransferase